jgi:hypothetical protein
VIGKNIRPDAILNPNKYEIFDPHRLDSIKKTVKITVIVGIKLLFVCFRGMDDAIVFLLLNDPCKYPR